MTETRTFALVGCGKAKKDDPAPAADLYTSSYFGLKRKWAEENAERWAILSAKYGIVFPDTEIPPYDVTVGDPDHDADDWARKVDAQLLTLGWRNVDEVAVLAGSRYTDPLDDVFSKYSDAHDAPFRFLLEGMGIGEQQKWLSDRTGYDSADEDDLDDALNF